MYQQFYEMLKQLEQRIRALEQENEELKHQLDEVRPIVIENINYKIQEINVQELKGTLNIGWSGEASIDDVSNMIGEVNENTEEEGD
ncbi:spore germination protein GerPC [Alkalihalobacterium alkalinitrilicum]|uniref:spore germination protein GerPC n=1 Tax=Alkalihalobacterium alkalinitrilicum TaxID=427920 RepID=UPI000995A30D|nr:spore germination protein GerPC [Alkalihalobacterium alkalinitrilicum]